MARRNEPGSGQIRQLYGLSRHAAGVVFVVEPQAANKTRMEEAVSLIRQAGSRIFGVVMNKDRAASGRMG